MENKKKILLILVILLLAIVVPFSLAIFIAMSNTESILEIEVETVDNKTLIFDNGDEIFLDVNISDFSTYGTDALATTSPSVRLTGKGNEEDKYSVFIR